MRRTDQEAGISQGLWGGGAYLRAWETGSQTKVAIARLITFYNHQRPHTAHDGRPPAMVYFDSIIKIGRQMRAVFA